MSPPLSRDTRLSIVHALRSGTVPAEGLEHFAVGLEPQMEALREQWEFVSRGHGQYRMLRGPYGSGKTFLAALASAEALRADLAVSHVVVSATDTPLYRLAEIYRKCCHGLTVPGRRGVALQSVVDRWLYRLEEKVGELDHLDEDDPAFSTAVQRRVDQDLVLLGREAGRFAACLKAYHEAHLRQDFVETRGILDWLSGEPKVSAAVKRVAGVRGQVDGADALTFLRGLLHLLREAGHPGLLLVLDEAETVLRLRGPERQKSLEALRQLIDALDRNQFPGLLLVITGTPDFFESPRGVPDLPPLHERIGYLQREGQPENLRQPQLRLPAFDRARLLQVARRVRDLYPAHDAWRVAEKVSDAFLDRLADQVTAGFGGRVDLVPRMFLRELVHILDLADQHPDYNPFDSYRFEPGESASELPLRPEESEGRDLFL